MIASIFNKSKPINFVIVFFIMLLAFSAVNVKLFLETKATLIFFEKIGWFFACYFTVLLLNFIVNKNSLTNNNHYQILLFGLFFLMLPQTTIDGTIIMSNIFVLLGLWRLLSLRSQTSVKKKLFDTAVWFSIATLCYFWAILFFIVIFITLLLYTDNRIKNWIVPFTGLATIFIISISLSVVLYDDFFKLLTLSIDLSFNYVNYNTPQFLIVLTLLFSYGVWSSIFYVKLVQKKKKAYKPSFKAILVVLIVAFFSVILAPEKDGSEFLFMFAPLSIIIANYIESISEKWFKELFLAILIVTPLVLLML